jgi:hypothetical protein
MNEEETTNFSRRMIADWPRRVSMPWWLQVLGVLIFIPSAGLCGRLVWEQTWLTWHYGPQMIGFALIHGNFAYLILAPFLLLVWIIMLVGMVVYGIWRRRRIASLVWINLIISLAIMGIMLIPYGLWQRMFMDKIITGPKVGEFMTEAAGGGDLGVIKSLLSHGISVDVTNRHDGQTGLHAAAATNRVDVARFLVSQGAQIDALDRCGDSPLERAYELNSEGTRKFLESIGAHRIRGSDTQRKKALDDEVHEDIEEMDSREK